MKLKNKYYILRHGKTDYQINKKEKIYPRDCTDKVPLSEVGRKDVKESAKKLKDVKITAIFSSDFLRTKQTAEIVKETIGFDKEIVFDKRLRDLDLGVWHEKNKEDYYQKFPVNEEAFSKVPEKGESWDCVEERMMKVLAEIEEKESGIILIISHGDPLWLLEGKIKNKDKKRLIKEKKTKEGFIDPAELRTLN